MFDPCEEADSKAGFYYDLKFVIGLLYIVFVIVYVLLLDFSIFTDFTALVLVFLSLMGYLDLQETIEVRVPRYGWKCSKRDFRLASAFLIASLFLIPVGTFLLRSRIAAEHPLIFILSLALLFIPTLSGIVFALNCYLDFGRALGYWKRDEEITKAFLKHSYFYRKIFRKSKIKQ
ncbi:MAG: hypothetical protein QHH17_05320 [Candidatus Bathyarchaeota archaeon]|jgi:hypothetical protein|nr:hypothetical protein [Candidatus Bathyarchaeota archaeon]